MTRPARYIEKFPVQAVTEGKIYHVAPEVRGGKLGYKYLNDKNQEAWGKAENWDFKNLKVEANLEEPYPTIVKEEGKKFDQDYIAKPPVDFIPPKALIEVGKVIGFGGEKYGYGNYLKIEDARRYVAAAQRHLMQNSFEENDPESGLLHLAHAACSILMAIEAQLNHGRKEWYVTD